MAFWGGEQVNREERAAHLSDAEGSAYYANELTEQISRNQCEGAIEPLIVPFPLGNGVVLGARLQDTEDIQKALDGIVGLQIPVAVGDQGHS
jgi:hypothetical protein